MSSRSHPLDRKIAAAASESTTDGLFRMCEGSLPTLQVRNATKLTVVQFPEIPSAAVKRPDDPQQPWDASA